MYRPGAWRTGVQHILESQSYLEADSVEAVGLVGMVWGQEGVGRTLSE